MTRASCIFTRDARCRADLPTCTPMTSLPIPGTSSQTHRLNPAEVPPSLPSPSHLILNSSSFASEVRYSLPPLLPRVSQNDTRFRRYSTPTRHPTATRHLHAQYRHLVDRLPRPRSRTRLPRTPICARFRSLYCGYTRKHVRNPDRAALSW